MMIEFFGAIGVADVAPILGANAVIVGSVGGDGGLLSGSGRIVDLRKKRDALKLVAGRVEFEEIANGGINIEKFGGFNDGLSLGESGSGEDEGNAGAIVPEGIFSGDALFADVPTVVGPEDDDGVFIKAGFLKGGHDAADLVVDEGGAGEIGAGEVFPFVSLLEEFETDFGEFPVEIPREAWGVIAVGR